MQGHTVRKILMHYHLLAGGLLFSLILSGCTAFTLSSDNYWEIKARTSKEYDQHKERWKINGPTIRHFYNHSYFLRAFSDSESFDTRSTIFQLYVSAIFRDWAWLNTAYSYGERFEVTQIHKEVVSCYDGCIIREDIGITISLEQLKSLASKETFSIQISGSGGKKIVNVPGNYIRAFLDAALGMSENKTAPQ